MKQPSPQQQALFQLTGRPPLGAALSLAAQHLVAMIVGCVTPAIIIANVVGMPQAQRVLLIQSSLVLSAISTLFQVFPIGRKGGRFRFGAGLPVILGVSFAYVPSMEASLQMPRPLWLRTITAARVSTATSQFCQDP